MYFLVVYLVQELKNGSKGKPEIGDPKVSDVTRSKKTEVYDKEGSYITDSGDGVEADELTK